MLKDLAHRVVTSSILIGIIAIFLFFADVFWVKCLISLGVAFLTVIALWEYQQFAKVKGGRMVFPIVALGAVFLVFSFFLGSLSERFAFFPMVSFLAAFIGLTILHFEEKQGAIVDLATSLFGLMYIAVPLGMMLLILYPAASTEGRFWLLYLIAVTKMGDIGGYLGGNLWGKTKLAETISPKKTIEGGLCGLLSALFASFLFYRWGLVFSPPLLGSCAWIVLGLLLGVIGQFGDLAESLLKRDANKKDSNALPGLGGVLDLVDSLLFNTPILYLYLKVMLHS